MTTQNHIHLSNVLGLTPEFAPNEKWKVVWPSRVEVPQVYLNLRFTLAGKLRLNTVQKNGQNIVRRDLRYRIKVNATQTKTIEERKELFYSWFGTRILLVDNIHCADGVDHTPFVQPYILMPSTSIEPLDSAMMVAYYIDVELIHDIAI